MSGHADRMLAAVLAALFAVWCAVAYALARALGRGVHIADVRDRQRRAQPYVAQLDASLWRGTDLDPPRMSGDLAGAILGLAYATDDTTARYWLAMCARRGATPAQLAELEANWRHEQARTVTYLNNHRKDHP
jgi:hypothetical protein